MGVDGLNSNSQGSRINCPGSWEDVSVGKLYNCGDQSLNLKHLLKKLGTPVTPRQCVGLAGTGITTLKTTMEALPGRVHTGCGSVVLAPRVRQEHGNEEVEKSIPSDEVCCWRMLPLDISELGKKTFCHRL